MAFLGKKAALSIDLLTKEDAIAFRTSMVSDNLWANTINETISFLRGVHQSAVDQGHISRNPFAGIDVLKIRTERLKAARREPFTAAEVAALVSTADNDWRGMVILGATTGLRLNDTSRLTWKAIDLERKVINLTVQKTGKDLELPMHPEFVEWISSQTRGISNAPIFRSLYTKPRGGETGLCPSFRALMNTAGITSGMAHTGKGKGRNKAKKSFHSLRHFAATQSAMNGVRADVARAITGHADAATHGNYVNPDITALRGAVEAIRMKA